MSTSRLVCLRVLAAACVLALFLPGCVRATPTPEPVTITFAHPRQQTEYYQQLVATFNQSHPYITVELRPKNWDMLGGLGPDDADTFVNSQFALQGLRDQNVVLELTPFMLEDEMFDRADFYPGLIDLYSREGATWAIPAGVDIMVMYYNADLLDLYNAPYPQPGWNWHDFMETAMAARDPSSNVFGYLPGIAIFDTLAFIYQHGGRIFDDLENPTRTTFDDPLTIEAVEWYARLSLDWNVAPTPEQLGQMAGGADLERVAITQGLVGMWTGMLSEQGGQTWRRDWNMNWGVAPMPRDQQSATMTLVEGYFISARTTHPDACWDWISFLSDTLPGRMQVPARRSLAESPDWTERVGVEVADAARASMEDALFLSPELVAYENALTVFAQALGSVISGVSTADEAMVWAQQQTAGD